MPRDVMELIGKCILPDVTMCVVARKYGCGAMVTVQLVARRIQGAISARGFMGMMLSNEYHH